jgi:putative CocE/NonD family hydrolase
MKAHRVLVVLAAVSALMSHVDVSAASSAASGPTRFARAGQSEAVHFDQPMRSEVEIVASDGVVLKGALFWRGEAEGEPYGSRPVILVPTPYNWAGYIKRDRDLAGSVIEFFTARGYVVVVADARGTGRSAGCADIAGPRTAADVVTWVEYLAARSWSNGKIGGFGMSYTGVILKAALAKAPEALRTAVVISAGSSLYDYVAMEGVPYWTTGAYTWASSTASHSVPNERQPLVDPNKYSCTAETLGTVDRAGDMTPFLRDRDFRREVKNVRASVLEVAGILEDGPQRLAWEDWFDELPTFRRGVLGQWEHESPVPHRPDFMEMLHAWYDHELLDLPTGIGQWPILQVQDADKAWRAVGSYAELAASHRQYVLGADGRLGDTKARGERSWLELAPSPTDAADPAVRPLPTAPVAAAVFGGVTFSSDRLKVPMHLSGVAELDAQILIDADDAHFTIELDEVFPNGTARRLSVGALSARHRSSLKHPNAVRPGQWVRYRVRTLPFDVHVQADSALRLRVSSADDYFVPAGSGYKGTIRTDGSAHLRIPLAVPRW